LQTSGFDLSLLGFDEDELLKLLKTEVEDPRWIPRACVMADCYSGNMRVVLAPGSKMTRMACWGHARREVYEHHESDPQVSALPLALMNQLYDIERRAMKMNDQEGGELRTKESRKILDRLGEYLDGPVAKSILPASKLGGACNYLRNHWNALNVFVNDGALPIDNNQVERLMKRIGS
jgi:hypothetical protein